MKNLKKQKRKTVQTTLLIQKSNNDQIRNPEQIAQEKLIEISHEAIDNYQNNFNLDFMYFRPTRQQNSMKNKTTSSIFMNLKRSMNETLKSTPQIQKQKKKLKEFTQIQKMKSRSLTQQSDTMKFRSKTVYMGNTPKSPIINYTNFILFDERQPVVPAQYIRKQQKTSNSIISKYKRYFNRLIQNKTRLKIENQQKQSLSINNKQFKKIPDNHTTCSFFKQKSKILKIILQKPTSPPQMHFVMKSNSIQKKTFFKHQHQSYLKKKSSQSFI